MKKIIIALLTLAMVLNMAFVFVGCDGAPEETEQNTEQATDAPATTDGGTEGETEPTEPEISDLTVHNIVADGKVNYAVVRPASMSNAAVKSVATIYDLLQTYTEDFVNYTTDETIIYLQTGKQDESTLEIIVGMTNYEGSAKAYEELEYGDYVITTIGNKIYIAAWSDDVLATAITAFTNLLSSSYDAASGSLSLKAEDVEVRATANKSLNEIIAYDGADLYSIYDCGNDANMLILENATKESFDAYLSKLKNEGYYEHDRTEMNENLFAVYANDKTVVNVMYTPYDNNARVIFEPLANTALYVDEGYEKVCDTLLFQVGISPNNSDYAQNGMCYMIRLEDGSFIVFDGGFSYNAGSVPRDNAKRILEIVTEYTPEGKTPTIKMWMITHLHGDHHGAYRNFINNYTEDTVKIDYVAWNYPAKTQLHSSDGDFGLSQWFYTQTRSVFPSAKIIKVHAGQTFQLANVKMETLYSLELYAPEVLTYLNTSSLVCKVYIGDQTFMMTGDMSEDANKIICKMYDDYLKSDFCQVAHHGYKGGSSAFYRLVDPTWVLWPISAGKVEDLSKESRSAYLINSKNVQHIFYARWDITMFNFPYDGTNHTITPIG